MHKVVSRARCALQHGFSFVCPHTPQKTWHVPVLYADAPACDDCRCVRGCMLRRIDVRDLCRFVYTARAQEASAVHGVDMYAVSGARPPVRPLKDGP
jgi:hypothetical protein